MSRSNCLAASSAPFTDVSRLTPDLAEMAAEIVRAVLPVVADPEKPSREAIAEAENAATLVLRRFEPYGLPACRGMTICEAARYLGISRSLLYEEIAAGRLIARKIASRTIIWQEDIIAYLGALSTIQAAPTTARTEGQRRHKPVPAGSLQQTRRGRRMTTAPKPLAES